MITDRSLRSSKMGPGKVRWIHLLQSKEAGAVWIRLLSHRIGLLTDPLGVTGFMCLVCYADLTGFITVSSFQGSGAARRYVTGLHPRCQSLLLTDLRPSTHLGGTKNASRLGGAGRRATAIIWPCPAIRIASQIPDLSSPRSTRSQKQLDYFSTVLRPVQETI